MSGAGTIRILRVAVIFAALLLGASLLVVGGVPGAPDAAVAAAADDDDGPGDDDDGPGDDDDDAGDDDDDDAGDDDDGPGDDDDGPGDDDDDGTSATVHADRRVYGADRYGTAAAISARAFPNGADVVYLARSDEAADALAAGVLTDGPILLVPRCGTLPAAIETEIARLAPRDILALGGPAAICDGIIDDALDG